MTNIIIAIIGSIALSAAYFAGLWWTVRRATVVERSTTLFALSFVARSLLVLGGLWLLLQLSIWAAPIFLVTFLAVRTIARRLGGPASTANEEAT